MNERSVPIEDIRIPEVRKQPGKLMPLVDSIRREGLHLPVALWSDGTLISGSRRLRAHIMMEREIIPAVFVSTIEDAAKRLMVDLQDTTHAQTMKWTEVCRLWAVLRKLDEPAAARRLDAARRHGLELRRQTQAGLREPGRASKRSEDYVLSVICEPFGVSEQTARRAEIIYEHSVDDTIPADKRELAIKLLAELDGGASPWSCYTTFLGHGGGKRRLKNKTPDPAAPPPQPTDPAAARQLAAWERALPTLEGVIAGLIQLGPMHDALTWEQVGPIHTRLSAVRRETEKMIKKMRETNA